MRRRFKLIRQDWADLRWYAEDWLVHTLVLIGGVAVCCYYTVRIALGLEDR